MKNSSRRSFVGRAIAAGAVIPMFAQNEQQASHLVYRTTDWNLPAFERLTKAPQRVKQLYDIASVGDGRFLNNIKNSLNGIQFGFGISPDQIKIVAALHGPANLLNFNDHIWEKYRVGEWLQIQDPKTEKPSTRNLYFQTKAVTQIGASANDPNIENSTYQDRSIQGLQSRGVQFLSCHTAMEEQARQIIQRFKLSASPESVVNDLLDNVLPHVLVVASAVAAIALLQSEGQFSYITVAGG